jgi:hypothetical protein
MRKRQPINDSIYALLNRILRSSKASVEREQLPVPSCNHLLEIPVTQPSSTSNCNVDLDISSHFLIE